MIEALLSGAQAFMQPSVLALSFVGVVAGILIGMIPGFTLTMGVILVLPFTFGMSPLEGIATMMGVAVGGASGGLISATLMGIPGTPSSVATTFDGFPMARRGEPGRALGLGTWAGLWGGIISGIILLLAAPPLSELALKFGPWEFFALIIFALTMIASLVGNSIVKGLVSGLLGMMLATVGLDPVLAASRFTFGNTELEGGFAFLPVLIGLFAFSQLMSDLERRKGGQQIVELSLKSVRIPTWQILKDSWEGRLNVVWSSVVGTFVGIIPAAGGSIANILAYDQARKFSRRGRHFGTGEPEGIIAAEAANNAVLGGAFIPMLAFGIPGDAITAVMLGVLLIHGIIPGPMFITQQPVLAYGVIYGYLAATVATLIAQLMLMRVFVRIIRIPQFALVPAILVLAAVGSYVLNNRIFDMWVLFGFGLLGYFLVKHGFALAPFVLGFILEPIAEANLKRALQTNPELITFVTRPISALFLLLALLAVVYYVYSMRRKQPLTEPSPEVV